MYIEIAVFISEHPDGHGSAFGCMAMWEPAGHTFEFIRIGDDDSFGFTNLPRLFDAVGGPVDREPNGKLNHGDSLPDLNLDGNINKAADNCNNRSAAEAAGTAVIAIGASDFGETLGSDWTDTAIAYPDPGDECEIGYVAPEHPGSVLGDQPGFVFDLFVAGVDANPGSPVYLNSMIGDVRSANIDVTFELTRLDGTSFTKTFPALTAPGTETDGFIQWIFVELSFDDVFAPEDGGYRGHLEVDVAQPLDELNNIKPDKYMAYNFAELN